MGTTGDERVYSPSKPPTSDRYLQKPLVLIMRGFLFWSNVTNRTMIIQHHFCAFTRTHFSITSCLLWVASGQVRSSIPWSSMSVGHPIAECCVYLHPLAPQPFQSILRQRCRILPHSLASRSDCRPQLPRCWVNINRPSHPVFGC